VFIPARMMNLGPSVKAIWATGREDDIRHPAEILVQDDMRLMGRQWL
jgi:hypothetical protein